jgi:hypothetical protein
MSLINASYHVHNQAEQIFQIYQNYDKVMGAQFIAHWLYGVILIFLMEQKREVAYQK